MKINTPKTPEELYSSIIAQVKGQGVVVAITGGLACVQFGVAHYTEDCDLICRPADAQRLFDLLCKTGFKGTACQYRSLSAPLDERWLSGGYTAHFLWPRTGDEKPFLDVFGVPPRVSAPWQNQMRGAFASPHTVAEMKRTKRRRDWDQATALGLQMIEQGDTRGWLHIFNPEVIENLIKQVKPTENEIAQRPVLRLAAEGSPVLTRAIQTEVDFWSHLDRIRLSIYQTASKPYARTVHRVLKASNLDLAAHHRVLVQHAENLLPISPLQEYGWERLVSEARDATAVGLDPKMLDVLPTVSESAFRPTTLEL